MPLVVLVSKVGGLYDRDELVLKKTTLDEAPALLQITGLFALIVFLGQDAFVHAASRRRWSPSCGSPASSPCSPAASRARHVAAAPRARPSAASSSATHDAIETIRGKLETAGVNAEVVASVRLDPLAPRVNADRFLALVRDNDVHRVIIAPVTTDARETLDLIRIAKSVGVRVSLLPRLFEVVGSAVEFDDVDGLTMLGVRRFGLTRCSHAAQARVRPRRRHA